jgi:ATP-dependent DNA ligase
MANRNRDDGPFLLLNERDEPVEDPNLISQIKYDGRRVMVQKHGDDIKLIGRDSITPERYPEVLEAFKKIPGSFVVDTEFAVFGPDGIKTDRGRLQTRDRTEDRLKIKLMSKLMPVKPVIFDLLELDGQVIENQAYEKRLQAIQERFLGKEGIEVAKSFDSATAAWDYALAHELEGIVERDKASPYIHGRTDTAIKVKRKGLYPILFTGYEVQNAGITLTNKDGVRCACNGEKHKEVKEQIDKFGYAKVIVRGMADLTNAGKIREIVFYKMEVDPNV